MVALGAGCAGGPGPAPDAALIVRRMAVTAPPRPALCEGEEAHDARVSWLVFTSPWCDACARQLAALDASAPTWRARGVVVTEVVTSFNGDCMGARAHVHHAARWAASTRGDERSWAIRSAPITVIIADGQVVAHVEGVASDAQLLELSGSVRQGVATQGR